MTCPSELGFGVVKARSLYSLYKNARYPRMSECYSGYVPPRNLKKDDDNFEKMMIYPNPASDELEIKLVLSENEKGELSIQGLNGKIYFLQSINGQKNTLSLETSKLQNGIYIVLFQPESGKSFLQKLVIAK